MAFLGLVDSEGPSQLYCRSLDLRRKGFTHKPQHKPPINNSRAVGYHYALSTESPHLSRYLDTCLLFEAVYHGNKEKIGTCIGMVKLSERRRSTCWSRSLCPVPGRESSGLPLTWWTLLWYMMRYGREKEIKWFMSCRERHIWRGESSEERDHYWWCKKKKTETSKETNNSMQWILLSSNNIWTTGLCDSLSFIYSFYNEIFLFFPFSFSLKFHFVVCWREAVQG